MTNKITIDPVTRLEGHGKIEIFLDVHGNVENAYFQIPELRGFEKFVEGRPAEDMPQITSRICGICPSAHHMASTKALDNLYNISPTYTAQLIREVFYNLFLYEDHLLHFFFLGGPDFLLDSDTQKSKRNILGVIDKVGVETGKKVINIRKRARDIMEDLGGKPIHPVLGLPGGVSKTMSKECLANLKSFANDAVDFSEFAIQIFHKMVLTNQTYIDLIQTEAYSIKSYYMAMVDENNQLDFYSGDLRIIDPDGKEYIKIKTKDFNSLLAEHVEPWSYIKFPYLKNIGWHGFIDGPDNGLYSVAPLARLNVSDGLSMPKAHAEYENLYNTLGGKPVHHILANHWARLIETLYAAEHLVELSNNSSLLDNHIRNMDFNTPCEGIGVIEAPRGTLIHHYTTDSNGLIKTANLIVASQNNAAAMCLAITRAAKHVIKDGIINDGLLNKIEIALRAFDPCLGCATHSIPGKMPLEVRVKKTDGQLYKKIIRDYNGNECKLTE